MLKIILDKNQRKELAKALYDIGKLTLTGMVIGQFITASQFKITTFILGLIAFILCFIFATKLNKGE